MWQKKKVADRLTDGVWFIGDGEKHIVPKKNQVGNEETAEKQTRCGTWEFYGKRNF